MEFSEILSVARLAVTIAISVGTVVLGVSGSLIGLIIRQSRVLGALEGRLAGVDELVEQLKLLTRRLESNERQVYDDTRGLADLRREVDRRCPEPMTRERELLSKGNGGNVVGPGPTPPG